MSCVQAVGDRARLLLRFEDLPEVVLGKHHRVLLPDGVHHRVTHVEQVGAEGQMRPVLFEDAEGQHAHALRLMDGLHEIAGGQLFPFGREFLRLAAANRNQDQNQ